MTVSLEEAFSLTKANFRSEGMNSSPEIKMILEHVKSEELSFEDARYELLERIKDRAASGILLPQ